MGVQIDAIEGDPCRSEPPISDPWLGRFEPPVNVLGFEKHAFMVVKKEMTKVITDDEMGAMEHQETHIVVHGYGGHRAPVQSHPFGRLRRCDSSLPKQEAPLPPQERDAAPCVLAWPTEAHGGSRPCLAGWRSSSKSTSLLVFLCIRTHHRCAGR